MRRTYTGFIIQIPPNGVFVFTSNTEGRHGMGNALRARNMFGALQGQPAGRQGRSFGIVVKDLTKSSHPSIAPKLIMLGIGKLYREAEENIMEDFYVAYSDKGDWKPLNGYTGTRMAEMFYRAKILCKGREIPQNVIFEKDFEKLIEEYGRQRSIESIT